MRSTYYQLFLFILLLVSFSGNSQTPYPNKRANSWIFGDRGGMHFNSGSPVGITGSVIYSNEGCASISDLNGNLLFYTNGVSLWNRNHVMMSNGNGLMGHQSTTQSAVIVPMPGDPNKYYVFTLGTIMLGIGNLGYSVVDMTLSGGNGNVVTGQKNIGLTNPGNDQLTEKLVAVQHSNGTDFWVIVHEINNNNFNAYLVTASGVTATPVLSSVGIVHTAASEVHFNYNSVGAMKVSLQLNKLAVAIKDMTPGIEIFDFNNSTGMISNPYSLAGLDPNGIAVETPDRFNYGLEFSPDGNLLYIGDLLGKRILQYNLNAGTPFDINASLTVIGNSPLNVGSLQIGPDCKIYVALTYDHWTGSPYIGVINNPNVIGTGANYGDQSIYLGSTSNLSIQGLPNFTLYNLFEINGPVSVCMGSQGVIYTATNSDFSYTWSVVSGTATMVSSSGNQVAFDFGTSGQVILRAVGTNGCTNFTKEITVNVGFGSISVVAPAEDTICSGISTSINLTSNPSGANFVWTIGPVTGAVTGQSNGMGNSINQLLNGSGKVNYIVQPSLGGCTGSPHSIEVVVKPLPVVTNNNNYSFCETNSSINVALSSNPSGASFNWNPGIVTGSISGQNAGTTNSIAQTLSGTGTIQYTVNAVLNGCSNVTPSTITIQINPIPIVSILNIDPVYCRSTESIVLTGNPTGGSFTVDGIAATHFTPSISGQHTIQYFYMNGGCLGTNNQQVQVRLEPGLNRINDTVMCNNTSLLLDAGPTINSYVWKNLLTDQIISTAQTAMIMDAGTYIVQVMDSDNCMTDDTIIVSTIASPQIDLGENINSCVPIGVLKVETSDICVWQDGSTGNSFNYNAEGTYWLTASNACGSVTDTIHISALKIKIPNLITPNEDGHNDFFEIEGPTEPNGTLSVFNRYGALVYENSKYNTDWSGKGLSDDVYFYEFLYPTCPRMKGWVQIVR